MVQEGKVKKIYQAGLREALTTVFRRKWLIGFVFVLVVAAMTAITFAIPDMYRSEAQILIRPSRESETVDPAVVGPRGHGTGQSLLSQTLAHREILLSSYVARQALRHVGVERYLGQRDAQVPAGGWSVEAEFPPPRPLPEGAEEAAVNPRDLAEALRLLRLRLTVSEARDTNVLNIALDSEDPQLACEALGEIVQTYIDHSIEMYTYKAPPDFFTRQIASTKEKLEQTAAELQDFRGVHKVGEAEGLQQQEAQRQISEVRFQLTEARSELEASRKRVAVLEEALAPRQRFIEVSTVGRSNPPLNQYKILEVELKKEIVELSALYSEEDRLLIAAREKLQIVQDAIAKEPPVHLEVQRAIDAEYDALHNDLTMERAQVQALEARLAILEEELAVREERFAQLITDSITTDQLSLEMELLTKEYSDYRDSLLRALVFRALDNEQVSSVSIVQPPTIPGEPVSPNRPLNIVMGVALGLLGGLAAAFTRDFLDQSLKTNEDVEHRLDLPVLVAISLDDYKTCT